MFSGIKNQYKHNTVAVTRLNKFSLNEDASRKICTTNLKKLQIKNAASVYQFVNLFNLSSLHKINLRFIERCFTNVSNTESFKHLNYTSASKIFASSSLFITSEIEVFNVAETWLNYKIEERSKYAKKVLMRVRLHLLSKDTIRQLYNGLTFFNRGFLNCCVRFLNEILYWEDISFLNTSGVNLEKRFCIQKSFDTLVCGGTHRYSSVQCKSVSCIDVNNLGDEEPYPPMIEERESLEVVYVKGDLYVFGGWNNKNGWIMYVDKYSLTSKTWSEVAEMCDNRKCFCACAFTDKIFLFGGSKGEVVTNSCLQFDTSDCSWKEVSGMNVARSCAACVVYAERIVVSGGIDNNFGDLNSVESYDVLPDKWSFMPNMNYRNFNHGLAVVNNKLFVISKKNKFEVFDNICKTFVTIKSPKLNYNHYGTRAYSIGKKILVFQYKSPIFIYDTEKNRWSEESCDVTRNLRYFSCVKVPLLYEKILV